ncbi:TPA: hypothetical protein HA265_01075, partial [Candidatus Woesearchaeota archaeon]|nr:hypothetical protein [Candidatus Woesearchaeota archaeon]
MKKIVVCLMIFLMMFSVAVIAQPEEDPEGGPQAYWEDANARYAYGTPSGGAQIQQKGFFQRWTGKHAQAWAAGEAALGRGPNAYQGQFLDQEVAGMALAPAMRGWNSDYSGWVSPYGSGMMREGYMIPAGSDAGYAGQAMRSYFPVARGPVGYYYPTAYDSGYVGSDVAGMEAGAIAGMGGAMIANRLPAGGNIDTGAASGLSTLSSARPLGQLGRLGCRVDQSVCEYLGCTPQLPVCPTRTYICNDVPITSTASLAAAPTAVTSCVGADCPSRYAQCICAPACTETQNYCKPKVPTGASAASANRAPLQPVTCTGPLDRC